MKSILSILSVCLVVYLFTFYIDGEMGVIIIAFLIAAPLFSLAFAVYARNRIKISFDCDGYVKKGSELEVTVVVEREGKFPLAVVEIRPEASGVFEAHNKAYRLSLFSEQKAEFTFRLTSKIGGNGEIRIKSVKSCGFLGFIKLNAKTPLPIPKSVGVIPEIPDVSAASGLIRRIADIVLTSEDSEENDTAMVFSANTAPGYEHREYVPGDSLKRINWKLSSKSSKLMVRLDEAAAVVQPVIALDMFRSSSADEDKSLRIEEKLLQSVFGLLSLLIKQGISCNLVYRNASGEIVTESIDNPDYPAQLLLKVLAVKNTNDFSLNPINSVQNSCACIIATTMVYSEFPGIIEALPDKDNACVIVSDTENAQNLAVPVWYLAEDNNFRLI